jgi:cyclophilin family peptidyl-prolyl cis-trans isomerase
VRLPPLYSYFGQLVTGRDVLAAIDKIGTGSGSPRERVVMESVTITEAD